MMSAQERSCERSSFVSTHERSWSFVSYRLPIEMTAICNCVYIALLFTVVTYFVLEVYAIKSVLSNYVPLYYTDMPLKLTVLPLLVLQAPL